MTIELSSHVLSFNKKLFLSVISLFIAFAICFMAFQYRREKEYKIELLNTQLQNYNDRLNDFLRGRDTLNIQQLNDYVDRKSTRLNSSHGKLSRMPSSA